MIETLSLQLALVLPGMPDEQDSCIARLSALSQVKGLDKVHVVRRDGKSRLCLHFDEAQTSLAHVRSLVQAAGALLLVLFSLGHALEHLAMDRGASRNGSPGRSGSQNGNGDTRRRRTGAGGRGLAARRPGSGQARATHCRRRQGCRRSTRPPSQANPCRSKNGRLPRLCRDSQWRRTAHHGQ